MRAFANAQGPGERPQDAAFPLLQLAEARSTSAARHDWPPHVLTPKGETPDLTNSRRRRHPVTLPLSSNLNARLLAIARSGPTACGTHRRSTAAESWMSIC